jgi:hypothetical protein
MPKYTIQGKIYSDWNKKIPYANQAITVTVTKGSSTIFGSNYQSKDLGSATTDANGYFSVTYTKTDVVGQDPNTGKYAEIHIFSQYMQFDGLAVNQNINKDFFHPTQGSLEVYLQTNNPLVNAHDTLFLGYYQQNSNGDYVLDTLSITNAKNGLYKTLTAQIAGFTMFYGRGWKDFKYGHPRGGARYIDVVIDGDPTVNKMTINY